MQLIHTVNTRSHVMLEILRDHYGIVGSRMKNEIQRMHAELVEILKAKNIDYASLRPALVPSMDKEEAIYLFDSTEIDTGLYGRQIFDKLLPLLDSRSTQSILVGDLLGDDQRLIYEIISESLILSRSFTFRHSTLIFGVYINNLSSAAREKINSELVFLCAIYWVHTNNVSIPRKNIRLDNDGGIPSQERENHHHGSRG